MRKTLILVVVALLLVQVGIAATVSDEISGSVSGFGAKVWDVLKDIYNFFSGGMTGFVAYTGSFNVTTNHSYVEAPVSSEMVGYWKLNGNADDETSNNNNGIIYGATNTTDCVFGTGNCAYYFNGNYIEVPYNATLDSENFSAEVWFKADSIAAYSGIISRHAEPGWGGTGWNIYAGSAQNIGSLLAGVVYLKTSWAPSTGVWYQVVLVHYSNNSNELYVNGNLEATVVQAVPFTTNSIKIGGPFYTNHDGTWFEGRVDNVIIYNKALTAAEVNERYLPNNTTTNRTTNLTIWDTTDSQPALVNHNVYVYANYTGDGHPINNSAGSCTLNFTNTAMNFNSALKRYFYNRTYSTEMRKDYTINCSSINYDSLTLSDYVIIVSKRINITNISYYAKTTNSARINWTTNIPGNSTVNYGTTRHLGSAASSASKVTKHSIQLSGLSNGTKYYFNVTSYNSSYNYAISGQNNFITKINNNAPIISSRTVVPDKTSAVISWNNSEPANSTVIYSTNMTKLTSRALDSSYILSTSVRLSGLKNHTTYYYNLTACDVDGNCTKAGTYSFMTTQQEQPPSIPHVPGTEVPLQLPEITPFVLSDNPYQTTLTPGGRFIFEINNTKHELKILNVYTDSVIMQFSSKQVNVTFQKGDTKEIDINGDNASDIKVTLKDIITTKIVFVISSVAKGEVPGKEPAPPEEKLEEAKEEEIPAKITEAGGKLSFVDRLKLPLLIIASLLVAAVIGIGGYYAYQKTATVELKEAITIGEMEKINSLPKPQLEVIMDDVYAMLKKKEPDESVRKYLEGANLPKNVADAIIFEMRKDFNRLDKLILYSKLQKVRGKPLGKIKTMLANAEWAEEIIKLVE